MSKAQGRLVSLTLLFMGTLFSGALIAQTSPVLALTSPFNSKDGLARLQRTKFNVDFFPLSNHFRAQTDRISCGPVAAAIVLNALRYNTEKAPLADLPGDFLDQMPVSDGVKFDPRLHIYTPENVMNRDAQKIKTLS